MLDTTLQTETTPTKKQNKKKMQRRQKSFPFRGMSQLGADKSLRQKDHHEALSFNCYVISCVFKTGVTNMNVKQTP
jgi:hypothetical protein